MTNDLPHIQLQKQMLLNNLGSWPKAYVYAQARSLGMTTQIEDLIGPEGEAPKPVAPPLVKAAPCAGCQRKKKGDAQ